MGGHDAVPPGEGGRKTFTTGSESKAPDEWQQQKSQGPAKSSRTRYRGKPQGKPLKIQIIMKLIRNTNMPNIFKARQSHKAKLEILPLSIKFALNDFQHGLITAS